MIVASLVKNPDPADLILATGQKFTGGPIPTFASPLGIHPRECWNRRTASKYKLLMELVFDIHFPGRGSPESQPFLGKALGIATPGGCNPEIPFHPIKPVKQFPLPLTSFSLLREDIRKRRPATKSDGKTDGSCQMRRFTAAVLVAGFVLPAQAESLARSTAPFSIDRSQNISTSGSISTRPTTQALTNSRGVGAATNGSKSYSRTESNVINTKPVGPPAMNPTGQTQAGLHRATDRPSHLVLTSRSVSTSKNIGTRPATQTLASMNSRVVGAIINQGADANLKTDGGSQNAPDKLNKKQLDDMTNAMRQAQADADKADAEAKARQARVHQAKEDIQQILELLQEMQPCTHC
jgi:hypothetical protein